MTRKYFGTDGIRGRVGDFPITPDFVLKLGWAVGRVLANKQSSGKILIGKDTRRSNYMFEAALEAGLSAAGVQTLLLGPLPTPAIAYLTKTLRAQAGMVISASHNPFYDNGFKIFSSEGKKISDEIELEIERYIDLDLEIAESKYIGKAKRINDAQGRYIEFCKGTINSDISLKGLKIIVDCANGATFEAAPAVFEELGAEVIEISVDPDGMNINEYCGATNPASLQKLVVAEEADLGIAFDGDGDRVIMVDHLGELVDGDEMTYMMARDLAKRKQLKGVVGTLMSNFGMEKAIQRLGVNFVRANVGDRYVLEEMLKNNFNLGGEASGHIIYLDKVTTGDGIVSALQVLSLMVGENKTLNALKAGMQKVPQVLMNVPVKDKNKFKKNAEIENALKEAEKTLGDRGRILVRLSGTELKIRVMVEGYDKDEITKIAKNMVSIIQKI